MSESTLDELGVVVECPDCGQMNRIRYERLGDSVRCGRCKKAVSAPAVPVEVRSSADFDRLVAGASIPVVVDFWAPWCGPCRMVAPEMQKVAARQAGQMLVVKVNTDALPELGDRFRIQSIPMFAVFARGREVTRTVGARPATDIEAFVKQAVSGVTR